MFSGSVLIIPDNLRHHDVSRPPLRWHRAEGKGGRLGTDLSHLLGARTL